MPRARNSTANNVLPLPVVPHTRVDRPAGSPPRATSSNPLMPVGTRWAISFAVMIDVLTDHSYRIWKAKCGSRPLVVTQITEHPAFRKRGQTNSSGNHDDHVLVSHLGLCSDIDHFEFVLPLQPGLTKQR